MPTRSAALIGAVLTLSVLLPACSGHSAGVIPADTTGQYVRAHGLSRNVVKYASGGFAVTLTPNFANGFGTLSNTFCYCGGNGHAQVTTPGPTATLGSGNIDFGNVEDGQDYLYKSAMRVSVTAPSAWYLFAAASQDFSPAIGSDSLLWAPSIAKPDVMQAGESAFEFGSATSPGWQYPISTGKTGKQTLNYDYVIRLQWGAQNSTFSTQVVYSVVPS